MLAVMPLFLSAYSIALTAPSTAAEASALTSFNYGEAKSGVFVSPLVLRETSGSRISWRDRRDVR